MAAEQREELLSTLKDRFAKNMNRHKDLEWTKSLSQNLFTGHSK
ncbi:hypothetical protein LEP1GSC200_0091 [Leptospira interrogans serovar Pomona str. CSL10083]|nr:hypothetical protein LEP1GSC200_0091 [Leptospira interrogans serovar Pomona str. CSL10083]